MRLRAFWRKWKRMMFATSAQGLGYYRALDDVWDHALDRSNPCHDDVRAWIVRRRKELLP